MNTLNRPYYSMIGKGITVAIGCVLLFAVRSIRKHETDSFDNYKTKWMYCYLNEIDSITPDTAFAKFSKNIPKELQIEYLKTLKSKRITEYTCDVKSIFEKNKVIEVYTFKNRNKKDSFAIYIGQLDSICFVKDYAD